MGSSVILVIKRIKRANMHSIAVEKLRNRSGFVIYSYLKDGAFAAVTRASEFLTRYVKGVPILSIPL